MNYDPFDYEEWDPKTQPYGLLMGAASGAWGWTWYKSVADLKAHLIGELASGYSVDEDKKLMDQLKALIAPANDFAALKAIESKIADIFFATERSRGRSIVFVTYDELLAGQSKVSKEEIEAFYDDQDQTPVYPLPANQVKAFLEYFRETRWVS